MAMDESRPSAASQIMEEEKRHQDKMRHGARWWKVFLGCCKNVVSEQETSVRDSTT